MAPEARGWAVYLQHHFLGACWDITYSEWQGLVAESIQSSVTLPAPLSLPPPLHVLHRQELLLWKYIIFKNRHTAWAWESPEQTYTGK